MCPVSTFGLAGEQNVLCVTLFPSTGPLMWYRQQQHIFFSRANALSFLMCSCVHESMDVERHSERRTETIPKCGIFDSISMTARPYMRETNQNDSNIYYSSADTTTEYYYLFGPWTWIYAKIRNTNSASQPIDRAAFRQMYADAWTKICVPGSGPFDFDNRIYAREITSFLYTVSPVQPVWCLSPTQSTALLRAQEEACSICHRRLVSIKDSCRADPYVPYTSCGFFTVAIRCIWLQFTIHCCGAHSAQPCTSWLCALKRWFPVARQWRTVALTVTVTTFNRTQCQSEERKRYTQRTSLRLW